MTATTRQFWDEHAACYDEQPDHGLVDPAVREAWRALLLPLLPVAPASILDLGCGSGSLSVLLATAGYAVRGMDLSPKMLALARDKAGAAGADVDFVQGDAAEPPYEPGSADVVLARHVLWALPEPDAVLSRWLGLLRPHGLLLLVEGRWSTGAGLSAADCQALVLRHRRAPTVQRLEDPRLWGGPVTDERYVLVSRP